MHREFYRLGFVIIVASLCALALYWMLAPFWGALAWGICLAFLLAPSQRWLTRKLNGRAGLAAGIITVLVPVLLAGPLLSLGVAFANQVADLVTRLQQEQLRFDAGLLAQLEEYTILGSLAEWLRQNLTATTEQLQGWLTDGAQLLLKSLAATGGNFLLGALSTVVHFFMMLFLLFFLLRDGRLLLRRAARLVPMEPRRRTELLRLVGDTTRAVVYGTGLTALAQGALVGVGFAIAGPALGRCVRRAGGISGLAAGGRRGPGVGAGGPLSAAQRAVGLGTLHGGLGLGRVGFRQPVAAVADFQPGAGVDTRRVRRRHRRRLGLWPDRPDRRAGAVDLHRRAAALSRREAVAPARAGRLTNTARSVRWRTDRQAQGEYDYFRMSGRGDSPQRVESTPRGRLKHKVGRFVL